MPDRSRELAQHRPTLRDSMLWVAVLAGPVAWVLAELVSYSLAATACWLGRPALLYVVPPGTLLIAGAGAVIARRRWREEPAGSTERGDPGESRRRFMALAGFWLCIAFAVAIVAEAVPSFLLRVCD